MHINIILISFVILLGLILSANDNDRNRRLYIIFCSLVFIFVAAFRSPEWMTNQYGIDTLDYKEYFESYFDLSWEECWRLAYLRYFDHQGDFDIGYVILCKILGLFTHEFSVFSFLADLIFFIPFGIILYRYSTSIRQLVFAFVFYVALVQIFLFGGARQIFAIGFDLMALLAVINRKKLKALLFLLLGATLHFSSLLFAIPLLMVWYDVNPKILKIIHVICLVLLPIVLVFPNQVVVLLGQVSGVEKYARYGEGEIQGGVTTFIFLIEFLSLFCLFAIKKADLKSNHSMRIFYTMIPFFTLLTPLIRSNGVMIRVSLYYHLFLVLLVPFAIDCMFNDKSKRVVYIIAILGLALLTLRGGGIKYYFFWQ